MPNISNSVDRFAERFVDLIIRLRWLVLLAAFAFAGFVVQYAQTIEVANNYRVFFSSENPELTAFETFQATYTKNDNFLFVIVPKDGEVFTNETLAMVEELTEEGWQIPFALRVDSITNFQYTYAEQDDLIVEDLIEGAADLTASELIAKRAIALAEPLLRNQLINEAANATAVNVVLQYPEKNLDEVPVAAAAARDLRARIEAANPNVDVVISGVSMLNNAFAETSVTDLALLMPIMFALIVVMTIFVLRSVSATVATMLVVILSIMVAMGFTGYWGIDITPIAGSAPIIILTLALADSIHILITMRERMTEGMAKREAIVESMRVNFLAIAITSLTTAVGFLTLNFSDAPPFQHLGTISAVGIAAAWLFSITVLPAALAALPVNLARKQNKQTGVKVIGRIADFVIAHYVLVLVTVGLGTFIVIAQIPRIEFSDEFAKYFDTRNEFRRDTDVASEYFGIYPVEFSVGASEPGGISEPEFLEALDKFSEWLPAYPHVTHVFSLTDIMKRLNKNLHEDDPSFYRIPQDRELSAQYLLLYELSLPYGLDLNDRINIDKSATRVTATLANISTKELRQFLADSVAWLEENVPSHMVAKPTSAQVMFSYIAERNVESMVNGTILAVILIALIMIVALRSVPLGLLSLVPNGLPILATFGTWAVLVGTVGFSVAAIASISLGIIVDDTVHFLTKFVRARREQGLECADAIKYAFENVGVAIFVNTVILSVGFLVLTASTFKIIVDMGLLTAIAIGFALILDFLFLPALLMAISKISERFSKGDDHVDALAVPAE